MTQELWPNFTLRIGSGQRLIHLVDDFMDQGSLEEMYRQFLAFPYVLGDSDRPDTTAVRHLFRPFELTELERDTPLKRFADLCRGFLDAQSLPAGEVFSLYANFNLHGDYQFTHEDGPCWTALLFVNARWEEDWGGELIFYGDRYSDPAYAVFPKPGRLAVFDGRIPHRGGVPSKHCFEPRISLAVKFRRSDVDGERRTVHDSLPGGGS